MRNRDAGMQALESMTRLTGEESLQAWQRGGSDGQVEAQRIKALRVIIEFWDGGGDIDQLLYLLPPRVW